VQGISLAFKEDGCEIDTDSVVSGFATTAQNGMVNIATEAGTDPRFPSRGTDLLRSALDGTMISLTEAQHASNFAALDTKNFMLQFEPEEGEQLRSVSIAPIDFNILKLICSAAFTSTLGQTIGIVSTTRIDV
jgi:hypothetical protein